MVAGRDLDWRETVAAATPVDCVPVAATDPLYVLYTSGTTGIPKGVVRDNGGHAVALKWSMPNVFATGSGEVFWAASDIGWTVGHCYIVYAPLLHGCTTVLYEGKPVGTPDAGAFWRLCAQHRVSVLFTAPTAFRAIKREDPEGKLMAAHDLSRFRLLYLGGRAMRSRHAAVGAGQARRAGHRPLVADRAGLARARQLRRSRPGAGQARLADVAGARLRHPRHGRRWPRVERRRDRQDRHQAPAAAWLLPDALEQRRRLHHSRICRSIPGYYLTGDAGYKDEDGYFYVMSRVDDIINVAGHRLSTGAIEEVLAGHGAVAECAVIGAADELKGEVPVGFVVLKSGVNTPDQQVIEELVERVRATIGAFACFKTAVVVKGLPKTRSGKILRGTMKRIADGVEYSVPATIDDPAVLAEIGARLQTVGYPSKT